jgi:hypothetical protein
MSESSNTISKDRGFKRHTFVDQNVRGYEKPKYEHGILIEGKDPRGKVFDTDTVYYIHHKLDRHRDHPYEVIKEAKFGDLEVVNVEYSNMDPEFTEERTKQYLNEELSMLLSEEYTEFYEIKYTDTELIIEGDAYDPLTVTISGWNKSPKREPETTLNQFV